LTGVSFLGSTLNGRRMELLAELLPKGSTVLNPGDPALRTLFILEDLARFPRSTSLKTRDAFAATPAEIDAALATARRCACGRAASTCRPRRFCTRTARIIECAANARLPAVYQWPQSAREGGLMAYGPDLQAMNRTLAERAARVLGGTPAGEPPILQPTRFDLVVDLKAARAIGLTLPKAVLLRATEVIE
jgi:putative ABC transport system substrate-binding protein